MCLLLLGGLYFARTLPREVFPQIKVAMVNVRVIYPGSTPEEIEKGAVIKIEEAVHDLEDIKKITSTVAEGSAVIRVEFESGTDIDQAVDDVKAEIDQLQNIPEEVEEIRVSKIEVIQPVISVAVFGDTTPRNLKAIAEDLRDELTELDEISRAVVSGVRIPEISVNVNPAKLEKYGMTFQQVANQIGSDNIDIPGGDLKSAGGDIRLRTLGEREDALRLEEIIIRATPDGSVVRVRDVATIVDGFQETIREGRQNGKPAATITIFKTREQDAIRMADAVEKFVEAKRAELGGGAIDIITRDNTADFIKGRLSLLQRNAFWGGSLVLLCLTLFLSFRVAFWAAAGIPISIMGTFIVMDMVGYSTNMITLFAFIVILGMVVDDAIILGENVYRHFQNGLSAVDAAIKGSEEVAIPILATILTTIAAFAPLTMITGTVGEIFRPLAGVVMIALSISLIEAFFILPSHLAGALGRAERFRDSRKAKNDTGPSNQPASIFARFWERKEHVLEVELPNAFGRLLSFVVDWRYVSISIALSALALTLILVSNDRPRQVLMQSTDSDLLTVDVIMASGSTVDRTRDAIRVLEKACAELPEIIQVFSLVGDQIQISMAGIGSPDADPATLGQVLFQITPAEERDRHSEEILADLRKQVATIPGISMMRFGAMDMGPTGAEFEVEVRGENLEDISPAVQKVKDVFADFEGVVDIRDNLSAGKLEARIALDPVGRMSGMTVRDLAMQLRAAVFGAEAQTLQRGREEVEVRVRLVKEARDSIGDLEQYRIGTPTGGRVPFAELATLSTDRGYATLARIDRSRAVSVEADLDLNQTDSTAQQISIAMEERLDNIAAQFPGISFHTGGEKEEIQESFGGMRKGFLFAIAVIYSLLALVFRSYFQPIIIMLAIPFGIIGGVLGHIVMGYPMTIASWIGLIALTGIVVNDSLILIDFINRARREGMGTREAIIQGGRLRLRPILLTSLTTVFGLLPLMAEQSFQAQVMIPMAISIAFGLVFATMITLLVIPCFYQILEDVRALGHYIWTGQRFETPATSKSEIA